MAAETLSSSQPKHLHIFNTEESWVAFLVSEFQKQCLENVLQHGFFHVFLCGGTTPAPIYTAIANLNLPWDSIRWWMGDERFVSLNHPLRNETMVENAMGTAWKRVQPHFVSWGDFARPEQAAENMNTLLEKAFPHAQGPHFCFLGMGEDGHTASLFPGSGILQVDNALAAATPEAYNGARRLSVTLPFLNRATAVYFVTRGDAKKSMVERVHKGDTRLVAGRIVSQNTHICWCAEK